MLTHTHKINRQLVRGVDTALADDDSPSVILFVRPDGSGPALLLQEVSLAEPGRRWEKLDKKAEEQYTRVSRTFVLQRSTSGWNDEYSQDDAMIGQAPTPLKGDGLVKGSGLSPGNQRG